jgi:hypothetical protein
MWQLENRTPFAAERSWVRDRDGTEVWLVAVKASFDILPEDRLRVAKEQVPVLRLPEHHGEAGRSSVKYDADLVLTKTNTDIVVVGHACAPAGAQVTQLDCGFRVGAVQKLVRIFGDRTWTSAGASVAQPFEKMPLVYERAFGGAAPHLTDAAPNWDLRNPVGTGFAGEKSPPAGLRLPNIEDPKALIANGKDKPAPAGLGVLATHWQPRVAMAGTYGAEWLETRAPLLAQDMDDRWYQSTPADQQAAGFLKGGEPVILHNLGPHGPGGRLQFYLPRVELQFETHFYDGAQIPHLSRNLHTVILEPDLPRVSVVWHTALPCHAKVHKLDRTIITLLASDRQPEAVGQTREHAQP